MLTRRLGLREYSEVWSLQKDLVERRLAGEAADTLLLCEHPPVYTRGRSAQTAPAPSLPHPLFEIERGGDITYHGPGQLVGYPIMDLRARGLGARSYLRLLEEALMRAVSKLGIRGERVAGLTGVWAQGKKIASLGVAVRAARVSYHGFALNVNVDLAPFRMIHPCKLEPGAIGSLAALLGGPLDMEEAARLVQESVESVFESRPEPVAA